MISYPETFLLFKKWLTTIRSNEALIASLGRVFGVVSNFVLFWLLVRSLDPSEYAQLGLINGLQIFVTNILLGPVLLQIGREIWNCHHQQNLIERLSGVLIGLGLLSLIGNITLVLLAMALGWVSAESVPGIVVGAVLYLIWFFISQLINNIGILRERIVFSTYLVLEGWSKVLIVLVLYLADFRAAAWVYFLLIQAAGLLGALLAYRLHRPTLAKYGLLLSRLWFAPNKFSRKTLDFMVGSKSLRVTGFLNWGFSTGNRYVLEPLVSRTTLGIFLAGWGLGTMALGAFEGFYSNFMIPVLYSRTSGECDNPIQRKSECGKYLAVLLAMLLPLLIVFLVFADSLSYMLLSNQIGSPTSIVRAGLVSMTCLLLTGTFQTFSLIERKLRPNVMATGVIMVIGLSSLTLLTIRFGVEIGAWGLAFGSFAGLVVIITLLHKWIDWKRVYCCLPIAVAGTVVTISSAWTALISVHFYIPDWGRWAMLLAWSFTLTTWASYVLLMVRPWAAKTLPESISIK